MEGARNFGVLCGCGDGGGVVGGRGFVGGFGVDVVCILYGIGVRGKAFVGTGWELVAWVGPSLVCWVWRLVFWQTSFLFRRRGDQLP